MKRLRAITVGIFLLAPSVARATGENVGDAAADARFREGLAFAKQGKYEDARASFLQTLALSPGRPNVLLNLAISEHGAGRPVEALHYLKEYLANAKVDPRAARDLTRTLYDELWRVTGHVRVEAAHGEPVVLDGEVQLGTTPLGDMVDVAPGPHRIAAGSLTIDVTVSAGETRDVMFVGATPLVSTSLKHVPVPPRDTIRSSPARWIVPLGLGVAAAGALAVGVGFAVAQRSAVDRASDLRREAGGRPCADGSSETCASYRDSLGIATADRTAAYVGYIAAGLAAVGAIATIAAWPRAPSAPQRAAHARLFSSIAPDNAAIHVHVIF